MLKNIQRKIRSLYRNKIQHTTKEWEEVGEKMPLPPMSNVLLDMNRFEFKEKMQVLFTGHISYRLSIKELNKIKKI